VKNGSLAPLDLEKFFGLRSIFRKIFHRLDYGHMVTMQTSLEDSSRQTTKTACRSMVAILLSSWNEILTTM
jgi:hypothetical protein